MCYNYKYYIEQIPGVHFLKKSNLIILCLLISIVFIGAFLVSLFGDELNKIQSEPLQSPESWLETHPYIVIGERVIAEPSSSVIVLILTLITLWVGLMFIKNTNRGSHLFWWGISFLLTGTGAGLAGVSYQAFGYELKCRGLESCLWTSWWEVTYMLCTVAGVGAAFIGIAYYIFSHKTQMFWLFYAVISSFIYMGVAVMGTFLANRFLISFEFMVAFIGVGMAVISIQCLTRYFKEKDFKTARILTIGAGMAVVISLYFLALTSNFAAALWERGIWFNENDLLHILMIIWVLVVYRLLLQTSTE